MPRQLNLETIFSVLSKALVVTAIPKFAAQQISPTVSRQPMSHRNLYNKSRLQFQQHNKSTPTGENIFMASRTKVQDSSRDTRKRKRRYAYEDLHEWPEGDDLDYDFEEDGEGKDLTFWQQVGRNWQVVALRAIFLLAAGCMVLFIACCCCKICCRVCCQSLKQNCVPCGGFLDILTSFYEDPMYKRAKNLADMMGLKLDYATYMKIKQSHDLGGTGAFNPLGLPYME